ncbi:unnamed protein product, partial [Pylaiella littoralis]
VPTLVGEAESAFTNGIAAFKVAKEHIHRISNPLMLPGESFSLLPSYQIDHFCCLRYEMDHFRCLCCYQIDHSYCLCCQIDHHCHRGGGGVAGGRGRGGREGQG